MKNSFGLPMATKAFTITMLIVQMNSCSPEKNASESEISTDSIPVRGDWIRVQLQADPNSLNPLVATNLYSGQICDQIFQSLTSLHPATLELVPFLAASLPEVSDSNRTLRYELRKEAKWDDGKTITVDDILFSFKCAMNPLIGNGNYRNDLDFVDDAIRDSTDSQAIIFKLRYSFFRAMVSIGSVPIFQQSQYDQEGAMSGFSIHEIVHDSLDFIRNQTAIQFAEKFNGEKFNREISFIQGSGPYQLEEWTTNSRVILTRKKNWWADSMGIKNPQFGAWPDKIIYKIMPDINASVAALKSGELDLLPGFPANVFQEEMKKDDGMKKEFHLWLQPSYTYSYIAMHTRPGFKRPPFFTDKKVRQAMAHLVNVDQIIETVFYGYAQKMTGPFSPLKKDEWNPNLTPIASDLQKANQLLDEAGWKDSDGDGIRDKMINGKKINFKPQLLSSGSKNAESTVLLIQKFCKPAGIEIEIKPLEISTRMEKEKAHDYDMALEAVAGSHLPSNLTQMWKSESYARGDLNIFGFGIAESDELIEKIQRTFEAKEREKYYHRFQEIIYDEQPAVFLVIIDERLALQKRFRNSGNYGLRPYYNPAIYWVPKSEQRFK